MPFNLRIFNITVSKNNVWIISNTTKTFSVVGNLSKRIPIYELLNLTFLHNLPGIYSYFIGCLVIIYSITGFPFCITILSHFDNFSFRLSCNKCVIVLWWLIRSFLYYSFGAQNLRTTQTSHNEWKRIHISKIWVVQRDRLLFKRCGHIPCDTASTRHICWCTITKCSPSQRWMYTRLNKFNFGQLSSD